jgi:predicted phage baseplate assembly protein
MTTPDAPVTYDLDEGGNTVPSLVLRVDGVHWDEVPSLYAAGPAQVFAVRLEADGAVTAEFGDGEQGARLPTGRGNVTATYRVGGGADGEVESGAIDTLVGSVRGVKRVRGAGLTAGGADQDSEGRLRRLVPTRARAFGRAVSIEDLVDLSLSYPGTSHAAAWSGAGPPGCACGGSGLHLAFVRESSDGPRPPVDQEVRSLSSFLDARRDESVALCVCAGVVNRPPVSAVLATDPRRAAVSVAAAATAALAESDGPLAPDNRALGQPLDRSDVLAVLHAVVGVIGVVSLGVQGATGELGRLGAARWELVYPSADPVITGQPA